MQQAIDAQAEHFAQGAGVDLGFSYRNGALVPDVLLPPSSAPCEYRPDAHPGSRLLFSSADGSFASSTLGRVARAGVTIFTQNTASGAAAGAAAKTTGVSVSVIVFGHDGIDLGRMPRCCLA